MLELDTKDLEDDTLVKQLSENLLSIIRTKLPKAKIDLIIQALDFATMAHEGQKRISGEPYITHPITVATILAELRLDTYSLVTALLHDTIEDTKILPQEIKATFGEKVFELVNGVTKLNKLEIQNWHVTQADNLRKLFLAISKDVRVLLVKLADRLHNMRTLASIPNLEKRHRIALETIEIYAPLAERIGIQLIKDELQDIAFAELYPEIRGSIHQRLNFLQQQGGKTIKFIIKELEKVLRQNDSTATVQGREKTPFSIWKKVEQKAISFEEISDIFAFRIITNSTIECYHALGIIHTNYHLVANNFQDFISNPKINGYQSLHTYVMGPGNRPIEIQIRSKAMHEIAEIGIASHWAYKQGETPNIRNVLQYKWLQKMRAVLENSSGEDVLENVKLEMHYEQVFCFTPKGHLIALPKGATPLDFAFAIHSDIGLTCVGARVNGKIIPLKSTLENGDQVEIFRAELPKILPSWENIVVTGKARAEIRKFLSTKKREDLIHMGKVILDKALKEYGKSLTPEELDKAAPTFGKINKEELWLALGQGALFASKVISTLYTGKINKLAKKLNSLGFLRKNKKKDSIITISNGGILDGITYHLSKCCCPLPGEKVIGVMSEEENVLYIHSIDCEYFTTYNKEARQFIEVSWSKISTDSYYISSLIISALNEIGSLALITKVVADFGVNILDIKVIERSLKFVNILLNLEVKGLQQINSIISALKSMDSIHAAYRYSIKDDNIFNHR